MAIKWREELWVPFEKESEKSGEVDGTKPCRRSFLELDSFYEFEVPGLLPESSPAMRKFVEDLDR